MFILEVDLCVLCSVWMLADNKSPSFTYACNVKFMLLLCSSSEGFISSLVLGEAKQYDGPHQLFDCIIVIFHNVLIYLCSLARW